MPTASDQKSVRPGAQCRATVALGCCRPSMSGSQVICTHLLRQTAQVAQVQNFLIIIILPAGTVEVELFVLHANLTLCTL